MRSRLGVLLLGAALAACGGGGGDGSGDAAGTSASSVQSSLKSLNYAGYQLAGGLGGFKRVHGTWTVPEVRSSAKDTASATWAGIGGGCADPPQCTMVEPTLIQAGTEQDTVGGQPTYFAWFEALPAPEMQAGGGPLATETFDVSPGDEITVDVDGSDLGLWNITIVDRRGGDLHWTFRTTVPYVSAGLTAEWIEEAPLSVGGGGAGQLPLSDFGRVSFSGLTVNGANPALKPSEATSLVDAQGNVLASPSLPAASGDAFDVCFGSASCS